MYKRNYLWRPEHALYVLDGGMIPAATISGIKLGGVEYGGKNFGGGDDSGISDFSGKELRSTDCGGDEFTSADNVCGGETGRND